MTGTVLGLTQQQFAYLLAGAGWTIVLSVAGLVGGTALGFPMALAIRSRRGAVRLPVIWISQIVQGIPLPVLLFLAYFGLSIGGLDLSPAAAAAVSLTIYAASYLGEIWAGALAAVAQGQTEAAKALGLRSAQILFKITLPQAARIATAPSVGFSVQLIKNTSYAVVIGVSELTYSARIVNNTTFQPFVIFTLAAGMYFSLCFPLSILGNRFERLQSPAGRLGRAGLLSQPITVRTAP